MRVLLSCIAVASLISACGSEQVEPVPSADIDAYIASMPYLPVDPPQVVSGAASQAERDGDYQCTSENLRETRQYDRIVPYAANSDSLWPGALVSADSVLSGLFTQIVLPRSPATISVSLQNLGGTKLAARGPASSSSTLDGAGATICWRQLASISGLGTRLCWSARLLERAWRSCERC